MCTLSQMCQVYAAMSHTINAFVCRTALALNNALRLVRSERLYVSIAIGG